MEIYGLNGNLLLNPPTTQDAVHVEELMRSDYVRLSWNDTSKMKLPVGAYVMLDGVKYSLLDEYAPQSVSECSFKYEPEFQHPYMSLGRMPLALYGKDANNQEVVDYDWSITDKPANILAYICVCINKALGIDPRSDVGWGFALTSSLDVVTATCSFNSVDILSGLAEVCNKFSTDNGTAEYVIDWENRLIRFGVNISVGSGVSLKVGENICPASVNGSRDKYYNRFVVKGSTRNISRKSVNGQENVSTNTRLTLDPDKYPNGYIDKVKAGETPFTKVLVYDDIFPRLDLYAYDVRERTLDLVDNKGHKVFDKMVNGKKTYKKYSIWYLRLAYPTYNADGKTIARWDDFKAPKGIVLDGYALKAVFMPNETGRNSALAGREFEMRFHDEHPTYPRKNDPETGLVEDTGMQVNVGDYEIKFNDEGGMIIPTTSAQGLVPYGEKTPSPNGDKVVLFNITMPQEHVKSAQGRLETQALKDIAKMQRDNNHYSFKSNPISFEKSNPHLKVGMAVTFDDGNGYSLNTRVTAVTTKIDYPFEQDITIGNGIIKGNTQTIKEDLKNANENINILSRLNNAVSTKAEAYYHALREIIERFSTSFDDLYKKLKTKLSKTEDDTAEGLITFNKGAKTPKQFNVGDFVPGASGATFAQHQGYTYLEVDKAYIRQKAIFNSLDIMKITYSFGNRVVGKGGVKITQVMSYASDDYFTCFFLAEEDGIKVRNPFVVNDLAICQEFNVSQGTTEHATNHFYWRKVVRVGENWVELSKSICASGSDNPLEGDDLCQLGYMGADKPDRQCAIMERTAGENVPSYVMLQGIDDFTLEGKDVISYGWDNAKGRAYMKTYGESFIGDRNRTEYVEYTPENGLEVKAKKIRIVSNGSATDVGEGIKNANQGVSNLAQRVTSVEVKANGIELKVEKRKIGGTNLLRGTAFDTLHSAVPQSLMTLAKDGDKRHGKRNCIKVTSVGKTENQFAGTRLSAPGLPDTEYTASVWLMSDNFTSIDAGVFSEIIYCKGNTRLRWWNTIKHEIGEEGKWQRFVFTFTTPSDLDFDTIEFNTWVMRNGIAYISEPQLEKGNVVTDWSENSEDVKDGLVKTGIDITEGKVKVTADNFEIVNPKTNETSAMIDGEGKIDAKHIAAKKVWSEIVEAGEIDAQNAKFKNMQVESGKVGGFDIRGQLLTNENTNYSALIHIDNRNDGASILLGMGFDVATGLEAAARIEKKRSSYANNTHIGLAVGAKDGIVGNHALYITGGNVKGFRRYTRDIFEDSMLKGDDCVLQVMRLCAVALPPPQNLENGQEYVLYVWNECKIECKGNEHIRCVSDSGTPYYTKEVWIRGGMCRMVTLSLNKANNFWFSNIVQTR
nr:MAG TPA: Putative tail protein [Caudoviricetes sp.]